MKSVSSLYNDTGTNAGEQFKPADGNFIQKIRRPYIRLTVLILVSFEIVK